MKGRFPARLMWPALFTIILGVAGCGKGGSPAIPRPRLDGVEEGVRRAVETAQEEILANPDSARAWGKLGDRYFAHLWVIEAAQCYENAEAIEPSEFRWPHLIGKSLRANDPDASADAFARAIALDDSYAPVHLFRAQVLTRLGRPQEARLHFRRTLELDPSGSEALLGLGQLDISEGRFQEARERLERALAVDPEFGKVHLALSQAFLALGDREAARRHAESGRKLLKKTTAADPRGKLWVEPVGSLAFSRLGRRLADEGKLEEAEAYLREALRINSELQVPRFALGVVLARQGEPDEAEEHLRKAIWLKPGHAEAHGALGNLLLSTREPKVDEALEHLEEAVRLNPDDIFSRYRIGVVLAAQEKIDDASEQLREVLRRNPAFEAAYYRLGLILAGRGDTAGAGRHFRDAIRFARADLEGRSRLIDSLKAQGKEAVTYRHAMEAKQLRSALAETHNSLGILLAGEGKLEEAKDHFTRTLEIRPDHPMAHLNLGRALLEQGRTGAGVSQLRQALLVRPDWPEVLRGLAWILATHEDPGVRNAEEAVRLAEQACRLTDYTEAAALDALAAAHAEAGRFDEAIRVSRQAVTRARSSNRPALARLIAQRMRLYEEGKPFRERH